MTFHHRAHSWLHPVLVVFILGSFGYGLWRLIFGG